MEYREVKLSILRVIRKRKGRGAAGREGLAAAREKVATGSSPVATE